MTGHSTAAGPAKPRPVDPERLAGWLRWFATEHGATAWTLEDDGATARGEASDGTTACLAVPFPPYGGGLGDDASGLVGHAMADRVVGVLLVRRGGYAAGVFRGRELLASKVGSRLVQGRAAAGGWSQQRFARRREQQARQAWAAAAQTAAAVLAPYRPSLDAVVTGGDRPGLAAVLADVRLAPLRPLVVARVLDVPDPRQAVLAETPKLFRATWVTVVGPAVG